VPAAARAMEAKGMTAWNKGDSGPRANPAAGAWRPTPAACSIRRVATEEKGLTKTLEVFDESARQFRCTAEAFSFC